KYEASAVGKACPDAAFFHNALVADLHGRDPITVDASEELVLTLRHNQGGAFTAHAVLTDSANHEYPVDMADRDCSSLIQSVALVVSGWLEPISSLTRTKETAMRATLAIAVSEPGADVILDGRAIGKSPLRGDVTVEPGPHHVSAALDGYASDEITI